MYIYIYIYIPVVYKRRRASYAHARSRPLSLYFFSFFFYFFLRFGIYKRITVHVHMHVDDSRDKSACARYHRVGNRKTIRKSLVRSSHITRFSRALSLSAAFFFLFTLFSLSTAMHVVFDVVIFDLWMRRYHWLRLSPIVRPLLFV